MKPIIPTSFNFICTVLASSVALMAQNENMESAMNPRLQVSCAVQEAISQARESADEAMSQAKQSPREARSQERQAAREAYSQTTEASRELQGQSDENTALLLSARRLRLQGQYHDAAKLYEQFIVNNPNSSRLFEARFWFAKSLLAIQEWDEATDAFTEFLKYHSDQRMYSQRAKEDRIYCWKVRQKQNHKAVLGLRAALKDPDELIRVQAALALAENKDASGKKELEQGLNNDRLREQCALALWMLGGSRHPKPDGTSISLNRKLVLTVKTDNPNDSFEMRVPLNFFKVIEKIVPPEARAEMARKGLSNIAEIAATAPKGQILFQFRDLKTKVTISVDE